MTYSILARDPETGTLGGAAATGSLCVGGWVLRGRWGAGLSASQGAAPSVYWGDDTLNLMQWGATAPHVVDQVTQGDPGRDGRQLAVLEMSGRCAVFDGTDNLATVDSRVFDGGVAVGNMLANEDVVPALTKGFLSTEAPFAERLLAALDAADAAGSDRRGLQSAALLVLPPDAPPVSLRIDFHATDPLGALRDLYGRATSGDYADWLDQVPNPSEPTRNKMVPDAVKR
jgi:uncharacterized Ntn-hydrolase superfamily protein